MLCPKCSKEVKVQGSKVSLKDKTPYAEGVVALHCMECHAFIKFASPEEKQKMAAQKAKAVAISSLTPPPIPVRTWVKPPWEDSDVPKEVKKISVPVACPVTKGGSVPVRIDNVGKVRAVPQAYVVAASEEEAESLIQVTMEEAFPEVLRRNFNRFIELKEEDMLSKLAQAYDYSLKRGHTAVQYKDNLKAFFDIKK
jgi:hypothetical protein